MLNSQFEPLKLFKNLGKMSKCLLVGGFCCVLCPLILFYLSCSVNVPCFVKGEVCFIKKTWTLFLAQNTFIYSLITVWWNSALSVFFSPNFKTNEWMNAYYCSVSSELPCCCYWGLIGGFLHTHLEGWCHWRAPLLLTHCYVQVIFAWFCVLLNFPCF